jgi:O-antigen/teichoic acid export membrane protein
MTRKKLFLENFLVYGLSSTLSKLIPFVMLPIIAIMVPDEKIYGIFDVTNVLVALGSSFAVLGLNDAVFRMFFEKKEPNYQKALCSNALYTVTISSFIVAVFLALNSKIISNLLFQDEKYYIWILLTSFEIVSKSAGLIVKLPTRMLNQKKIYVKMNIFIPVFSYSLCIPLILTISPLFGLIVSRFLSVVLELIIFYIINRHWFSQKRDKTISRKLLKFGLPLTPTVLILWLFNSFDRIMISNMLGPSYNGIYAIGYKVAMISQLIYQGFSLGWQYFAFSTMNDTDHLQLVSKIWNYLTAISFSFFALVYPFSPFLFNTLFSGEYQKGIVVFPFLFISPLILMLYQIISVQFLIIKKTIYSPVLFSIGASLNISFNFFLIPFLGIQGAAIATLIGYVSVLIFAIMIGLRKRLIIIYKKSLLIIFAFILLFSYLCFINKTSIYSFGFCLLFILMNVYLYKKETIIYVRKLTNSLRKKR